MRKEVKHLTENQYNWLKAKHNIMYVSTRLEPGDSQILYGIYNDITGENKKPNGCGACLRATISAVRQAYEGYETNQ